MLETVVTSSVLIAVLILLRAVFKGRIRLSLQYALWLLVAIRLLLPFPLFNSALSVMNVADITGSAVGGQAENTGAPVASRPTQELDVSLGAAIVEASAPAVSAHSLPVQGGGTADAAHFNAAAVLRIVWLIGAAAMGLWFVIFNLRLYVKLRRTREPAGMQACRLPVYLTRCVSTPCLFGIFRPAVYLPHGCLEETQAIEYILAHEETHYRHGDQLWAYLRCLCLALYWFNPLVWWAAALSRRDCELACDEGTIKRIGEENRRAYGHTLINMIAPQGGPSELLCGATTMTSGKRGIKERITMIANKPRRLAGTLIAVVLIAAAAVGCTFSGANGETPVKGADPPGGSVESGAIPLTAEELDYFNGDDYFNGEPVNIRNQFLSSLYNAPEKIDLFQLFYCGSGVIEIPTEAELEAVIAVNAWDVVPDCYCEKTSRANMDAVLSEYMGLTLEETEKIGLDQFTYLEEFDAYYYYHGDTNYRGSIAFYGGEQEGDVLRLFYNDTYMADGEKVLTLRVKDGGYLFASNQKTGEDAAASSSGTFVQPDVSSVPDAVLGAANRYMQKELDYWNQSSGVFGTVDGKTQMIGEPASYDMWRLEELSFARTYSELNGRPVNDFRQSEDGAWDALDIYRLVYRLHTTTPDKVVLAGGMNMDDDGWVWITSPYLIFTRSNGNMQFLSAMIDEVMPDAGIFTDDLISHLTAMKAAYGEAVGYLRELFADGESIIWYLGAGETPPESIPGETSYILRSEQNGARYEGLFNVTWEKQYSYPEPQGASVCLGDSPQRCFRFFPGSDFVLWRDGNNVTAWRASDANGGALPDSVLREFPGYSADTASIVSTSQEKEIRDLVKTSLEIQYEHKTEALDLVYTEEFYSNLPDYYYKDNLGPCEITNYDFMTTLTKTDDGELVVAVRVEDKQGSYIQVIHMIRNESGYLISNIEYDI